MAFEQEVELSLTIPSRELSSAREQIEGALSDVPVSFDDGPAARAAGDSGGAGASAQSGRQMRKWARQRTEDINDILDILLNMNEGGMGGGGGGMAGRAQSVVAGVGGRLSALLGGVSLANIVTKVPLRSLLTRAPAFATLVTAADLSADLVTGQLTAQDVFEAPMELGQMVTFGMLDNSAVESAIGTVTLAIGTYQIGSIVAGTLSGSALSGYFGTIGIGSILSGTAGSSALAGFLGTVGIGTLLTGLAAGGLAAYLGTVGINQLITGEITFDTGPLDEESERVSDDFYQGRDPRNFGASRSPSALAPSPSQIEGVSGTRGGVPDETRAGQAVQNFNVDNSTDVTVESNPDPDQIKDDVMSEVERENEQLRKEIERSLR